MALIRKITQIKLIKIIITLNPCALLFEKLRLKIITFRFPIWHRDNTYPQWHPECKLCEDRYCDVYFIQFRLGKTGIFWVN